MHLESKMDEFYLLGTAVLGSVGYLYYSFGIEVSHSMYVVSSLALLTIVTILISGGIYRSSLVNAVIVSVTLIGLTALIVASFIVNGFPVEPIRLAFQETSVSSVLYGSALMFVAYTGYGRIATLGEEITEPRKTIPKAIIITMAVIVLLYLSVSLTALSIMGAEAFGKTADAEAAPLMIVAQMLSIPFIGTVVSIAAITAMLGVLLNLILGLSRVLLGMAHRRDVPGFLSGINPKTKSPVPAVSVTAFIIGLLVLSGDVIFTWSFSAFTVLIYYSITNLSALIMPKEFHLYPRWIPITGLLGCLFLAFWIETLIWGLGLALLAAGLLWYTIALSLRSTSDH